MNFLIRTFLVFGWGLVIFISLTAPVPEYNPENYGAGFYDKGAHIALFGIFAYLIIYALIAAPKPRLKLIILISFIISSLYAILGEYIQTFIPGRGFSWLDFWVGVFGICLAQIYGYFRFKNKKT